jgi:hypothetical protein
LEDSPRRVFPRIAPAASSQSRKRPPRATRGRGDRWGYRLAFFFVDFFAVFFLAFFAAISWLLRVGVCSSVRRNFPDAVYGMLPLSKARQVSVANEQRIVLLVLTNSPQWLHSTNFTHVSSRLSRELEKILTPRPFDDRIIIALAR